MRRMHLAVPVLLLALTSIALHPSILFAQPKEFRSDAISGGGEANALGPRAVSPDRHEGSPVTGVAGFTPGVGFLAYNFNDNITETGGFAFIPPDPCGAAGLDRVIAVVNVGIECRDKAGVLIFRDALRDFFAPVSTLGTFTFDPKIVYDHYENRFVVVALEQTAVANGAASDESRILVAVSKNSTPATATAADWWYLEINSKINIGGPHWADYPGFEVDEEAVYITNNMYSFATGSYGGVRLWIIDKGVAAGFYAGGAAAWNVYDPVPSGFFAMTSMPALVFGAGGAGAGIGTYLVGYSSLTTGGPGGVEAVQVIRVDNPLGAPVFTGQFVTVGDLEDVGGVFGFPAIPDAPQSGSAALIEVNDSRALDAVWRNNDLWVTTTINPNLANDPINTGQATAHWFRIDTTTPAALALADQGNIGGEDIATDTWTFFPAVAVNGNGDAKFGFAASAQTIFCGAYFAGRQPFDAPGTVQASGVVQAGLDFYLRDFGTPRNRWGDYTGAAVDPSDDNTFWVFNEYAEVRGTGTPPQDGRWGTAWRSCAVDQDFGDAPDPYPTLLASNGARHTIIPNVFMGALIDAETDGQPDPNAKGDDLANLADEDGVVFVTPLIPGAAAQVDVTVSTSGWLDAWIDFDQDGTWNAAEQIYSAGVSAGLNAIGYAVPAGALIGQTFARFRFNVSGLTLAPTGPAPDGEVEDYEVFVEEPQQELDFGDAPDQPYPTLLANNGARHVINTLFIMGALIDPEPDGQPHPNALGDDIATTDDEDGVTFVTPLVAGQNAQVDVVVSNDGWLDVWFDFNINGSWLDAGEQVYSAPVVAGVNPVIFAVPAAANTGLTFARFRYNSTGPLPVDGLAQDGEVEDYEVRIDPPQEEMDFGDAPDRPYPTLLANNGARHVVNPNMFMGLLIDTEPDGQPHPNALGDDLNTVDDEDGVVFMTPLVPFGVATVDITVSLAGRIDAWIDFNADGVWNAVEQIFVSVPVAPGLNSLNFNVPATGSTAFVTFARFRYSTLGGLTPVGQAPDGEVEDYEVTIEDDPITGANGQGVPEHFALRDAVPNPFNPQTTLTFALPQASHVKLTIFDVRGRVVATLLDEERGAGIWSVEWTGLDDRQRPVASGVYLYRLEAGSFVETKRMVLVK